MDNNEIDVFEKFFVKKINLNFAKKNFYLFTILFHYYSTKLPHLLKFRYLTPSLSHSRFPL